MDLAKIFKAYDVRGIYPAELNEPIMERIGAAFAVFSKAKSIVVGRDMRTSSEPLASAFIEGAAGQGVDVVDIGLCSTDGLYFASGRLELPGAMFTASHNPAQYNGIKFCLAGAAPVGQETGLADIRRIAEEGAPAAAPGARRGSATAQDLSKEFVQHLLAFIKGKLARPLKVAVDTANGMGGKIVPEVFGSLPLEVIPLYFELDGTFPNHPADPIQPENIAALRRSVTESGADIGMAFDGDADRVFLVDERAEPVSGSLTAALVAARLLPRHPAGSSVVYNLVCSKIVPETVVANGGKPIRSRVGHSFIKKVMADTGALFGAEHSGHYYFRDNYRADSGMITALLVLEALAESNAGLSEVLRPFRKYWNSGEINTVVTDQAAKTKQLAEVYSDGRLDWTDGLTVEFDDWWFNVRGSNTEPLLRLNVETADEAAGKAKTQAILELIRQE